MLLLLHWLWTSPAPGDEPHPGHVQSNDQDAFKRSQALLCLRRKTPAAQRRGGETCVPAQKSTAYFKVRCLFFFMEHDQISFCISRQICAVMLLQYQICHTLPTWWIMVFLYFSYSIETARWRLLSNRLQGSMLTKLVSPLFCSWRSVRRSVPRQRRTLKTQLLRTKRTTSTSSPSGWSEYPVSTTRTARRCCALWVFR